MSLGVHGIVQHPEVLNALNPMWAVRFFIVHPGIGVAILGAVVLALTGAEALYADMGHFRPQAHCPCLVRPGPAGPGAQLLLARAPCCWATRRRRATRSTCWRRAGPCCRLVGLATLATVIASQAVISGAFSLTRQAIQLGYIPRMHIQHTVQCGAGADLHRGGELVADGGRDLAGAGVRVLPGRLASAYGVAVTGTMLITSILVSAVMLLLWKWPPLLAVPVLIGFLLVDGLFFAANVPKIVQGGAFPVLAGIVLFILMTTWKRGKELLVDRLDEGGLPLPIFISSIRVQPPHRVQGTAVFLTARPDAVPMPCCITCCITRCCMSRWCC